MLEKTVETYLVDRVRAAGGDAYKFSSPARVSVPDRIVVFPPARIYFVELKRPGGKPTKGQLREHERLRALGCDVRVIDSREAVDAFVREASRVDALTRESIEAIARKYAGAYFSGLLFQDADSFARFSDDLKQRLHDVTHPDAPADERVAFDLTDTEWVDVFDRIRDSIPNVFGSYMKVRAAFAREAIRLANEAHAASANETGGAA